MVSNEFYERVKSLTATDRRGLLERRKTHINAAREKDRAEIKKLFQDAIVTSETFSQPVYGMAANWNELGGGFDDCEEEVDI